MRHFKVPLTLISMIALCGCSLLNRSDSSSNSVTSSSSSSSGGSSSSSGDSSSSNDPTTSYPDPTSDSPTSISIDYSTLKKTSIISGSLEIGSYSTGNYSNQYTDSEIETIDNIEIEHYRAVENGGVCKLLAYYNNSSDGTIAGSLSNKNPLNTLYKISITYSNEGISSYGLKIYYGNSYPLSSYQSLPCSSVSVTDSIEINAYKYFRIETSGSNLSIFNIDLYYESVSSESVTYASANAGDYRINPVTYSSNPSSGDTVEIPTSIARSGNKYVVSESKTLTYYTTDDILSGTVSASKASLTDPFDVAAYYVAFGSAPANYVSDTYGDYSAIGSYLRKISNKYTRTDGYVNAIPGVLEASGFSSKGYYELDIAIDSSYSTSNRGVGRVIVFPAGNNASGYDSSTYAVFTDDHYGTFQEFMGYKMSNRFDAQVNRTGFVWSNPTTLSK